jgi:hypothetical protein
MKLRLWTGVRYIRRAPTRSGDEAKIRVALLTWQHVLWWHGNVQPIIDEDPDRVDQGWNWLLYAPFSTLTGTVLGRNPVGYCVGLVRGDRFVPCALAQLLGDYPALDDNDRRSTFTWFLTTAPRSAMLSNEAYGLTEDRVPKRLGTITLDVAVTHSINHGGGGRMSLHADPKGGERLLQWYRDRGMLVLARDRRLPAGPRRLIRPSDGRYCYFTVEGALQMSRGLDHLR